ncbi:hypothetical protein EYF80_025443 [Liparis tanakae]|uniref:Uncharacterized protein n=1 Tax=Liparis tanakae TaxID=230148 RepID=A0A4Z2HH94_9TELE|nr:hypothetical protein EYF80_025443 [Liparis tanakae]
MSPRLWRDAVRKRGDGRDSSTSFCSATALQRYGKTRGTRETFSEFSSRPLSSGDPGRAASSGRVGEEDEGREEEAEQGALQFTWGQT